jgi:hypothetical protein
MFFGLNGADLQMVKLMLEIIAAHDFNKVVFGFFPIVI